MTKALAVRPTFAVMELPAQPVLVEYHDSGAHKVSVAGSFNDWQPNKLDLIPTGNGNWARELVLAPGTYEYRFVVDGDWKGDPAAKRSVPNPFGTTNAVLVVGNDHTAPATQPHAT